MNAPLRPFTLLQVTPELETGGAEQTTLDIAAAVTREGGRALVASRGGRMAKRLKAAGGELILLPVHSKNPLTILANAFRMAALIRKENVSLIHARSRAPAFSAYLAARLTRRPFLATYHGVYSAKNPLKRWYNAIMTRGDWVIANSAYTRARVIAEHGVAPEKVIAIPRGVDLTRFDPDKAAPDRVVALRAQWGIAADDKRVKFLLAARLTRWKGHALLIEAVKRFKAKGGEDVLVLLVGDDQGRGAYQLELEAAIRAAGLHNSVRLLGHCDDMPTAYLIADVACAPSLLPEPFGRTAVEPQLMGRPVIASDHGATRETVVAGETGWLVKPGDPDAWAEAISVAVTAGASARTAMGRAGMDRGRQLYSVDVMCASTLEIYRTIMKARR